jgi:hypothetical protein
MSSEQVPVTIGGVTYLLAPMPFFCLERAWPHIQEMAGLQGDFVAQTRAALGIIAAALALDDNPPSADDLARHLKGSEIVAMHEACTALLSVSGLNGAAPAGEASATSPAGHLNGLGSSLN